MDYEAYQKSFFTHPEPEPSFQYVGMNGVTLYYQDYSQAVQYYEKVLGQPAYVEGDGTRGWRIGNSWLTLLKGQHGNPVNVEVMIVVDTPQEAERLQQAFIAAGATGNPASDQLMYEPVRMCPLKDPLGVEMIIVSPLSPP
jgi:hypothetical protein